MFQLKGTLKVVRDTEVISDKFKKREFVLTDDSSQYPQHCLFQLTQDRTDLLNNFNVGDQITVHFNLRGREWTSPQGEVKYFNSLDVWRLEADSSAQNMPEEIPAATDISADDEDGDLPF